MQSGSPHCPRDWRSGNDSLVRRLVSGVESVPLIKAIEAVETQPETETSVRGLLSGVIRLTT